MFTSVSWARSVSVSIFDSDEADRSSPGPSKAVSPFVPHSATALHTFTAPEPPPYGLRWEAQRHTALDKPQDADVSSQGPTRHRRSPPHEPQLPRYPAAPPPELPQLIQLRIMGLCGGGRHFPEGMDIPFSWAIERHPLGEEGMS